LKNLCFYSIYFPY